VVKETVKVPVVVPAALLPRLTADAATAVTAPTEGTVTKAATVSLFVSIFRPVVAVALNSAFAERVKPEHVTTTGPAGSVAVVARVSTSSQVAPVYAVPDNAAVGEEMPHNVVDDAMSVVPRIA